MKSGWFNESKRHSLASRGIKTAQKIPMVHGLDTTDHMTIFGKKDKFEIKVVKTDNEFPYKVEVYKNGVLMDKSLLFKDKDEAQALANDWQKDIIKKWVDKEDYVNKVGEEFAKKGFTAQKSFDGGLIIKKDGIQLPITNEELNDESYQGVIKHFDHINEVYNFFKNEPYVFSSNLERFSSSRLGRETRHKYGSILYSKIVDLLRANKVKIENTLD